MNKITVLVILKTLGQAIVDNDKLLALQLVARLTDEIFIEEPKTEQQGK